MTSKALKEAAEALRGLGIVSQDVLSEAEDGPLDPFVEWAAEIIRAFGQNISKEAASECNGLIEKVCYDDGNCEHPWEATPEQIRAAIEWDLE